MFFSGTFTPKIDDKGRFFLPAKVRSSFLNGLVISIQPDRCLAIWEPAVFVEEMAKATAGSMTSKRVRDLQRLWASGSSEEEMDAQGRVSIPGILRAYARLQKEIVIIGAYNHLEIWDAETWQKRFEDKLESFANMDEE